MQLTQNQNAFVKSSGKNVLVSASAGSGKTSTMIERLLQLVVEQGVALSRLLVLTFTDAAANEMKQRLRVRLTDMRLQFAELLQTDKTKKEATLRLQRVDTALEELSFCDIGTFHATFKKIITKYFYLLEIDPAFSLLTEERDVVLAQAVSRVFKAYTLKKDDAFYDLMSLFYKKRSTQRFQDNIKSLYDISREKIDFDAWFEDMIEKTYNQDLNKNQGALFLKQHLNNELFAFEKPLTQLVLNLEANQMGKQVEYFEHILDQINALNQADSVLAFMEILNNVSYGTLRFGKLQTPEQEDLKEVAKKWQAIVKENFKEAKNILCGLPAQEQSKIIAQQKQQLGKLLQVLQAVDKEYSKIKQAKSKLDFGDLQLFLVQLLQNKDVVNELKQTYQAIFVDEFQDINEIQFYIIKTIAGENNVNYIGDVKQSIYEFRLASPDIFLGELEQFEQASNAQVIPFNKNYRSSNHILQFVNNVFAVLITKNTVGLNYAKTSMLQCGNQNMLAYDKQPTAFPAVQASILHVSSKRKSNEEKAQEKSQEEEQEELSATEKEAELVAEHIKQVLGKPFFDPKADSVREVQYSDIAILTRGNNDFNKVLVKTLETYQIPVFATNKANIFETHEVQVLYSFLKLLNNEQDDYALATVLKSRSCAFSYDELAQIRLHHNSKKVSFVQCVKEYIVSGQNEVLKQKLITSQNMLARYRAKLTTQSVFDVVQDYLHEFGWLQHFASMPNGRFVQNNVAEFLALINTETFAYHITMCMNYLQSLQEKENFEVNQKAGDNAVTLSTMHKSKGLEWPVVILANLGGDFYKKPDEMVNSQELGIGFLHREQRLRTQLKPISYHAVLLHKRLQEMKEQIRLLYVAMTRAKNYLFLTGKYDVQKLPELLVQPILKSKNFLQLLFKTLSQSELNNLANGTENFVVFAGEFGSAHIKVVYDIESQLAPDKPIIAPVALQAELQPLLQGLQQNLEFVYQEMPNVAVKNSVTGLLQEQDYVHATEHPTALLLTEQADEQLPLKIGTAYHYLMQNLTYDETKEQIAELVQNSVANGSIEEAVASHISVQQIVQAVQQVKPLLSKSQKVLKEQQFLLQKPYNEFVLTSQNKQPVMVQGVIDLLLLNGEEATVIDFKTNKTKNKEHLKQTYALQLHLYATACKQAFGLKRVKKLLYSFEIGGFIEV